MPSTVEQLSPTRVKITVEVPFAELQPDVEKAYRQIASTVNIPGFRKGKVPPMVIDQRFGRGAVLEQVINDALPGLYTKAVNDNHLRPMASPDVEVTRLEDGDLLEFTAEVDVRPEFDLPDFSTLTATVDAIDTSDEEVDARVELLRKRFAARFTVDRPAADGDIVTIDLVASKDGEALEDATAEQLEYAVGSGDMLDGLDEAVTGLAAGDKATFVSTLVGGPRKDEEATIEVSVTKVQEEDLAELNDEFAQEASEFDTLEEMKADLRSDLDRVARLQQAARARDAVLEDLLAKVDLEVPANLHKADLDSRRESIEQQLAAANLSLEDYLAESHEADTPEEFWADLEQRSNDALRAQIILDKVADDNEIGVDHDDLTQHILRKAQSERTSPQDIASHLQEHPHHIDEYAQEIRRGKALAMIVEAATVTDTNGAVVDLAALQVDDSLGEDSDLS